MFVGHPFEVSLDISSQQWLAENAATVLDAVVDAIITMDASGTILSVNDATSSMFGYADEDLIGAQITLLMPSPYREQHQRYVGN